MKLHDGFEVVCPDGHVRHYPYHNEGDAKCDAEVFSERGCSWPSARSGSRGSIHGQKPACPGGTHTVRASTMACPEACTYNRFSSRTCERGTNGCTVKHGGSA
jgi:hypothetical protein